MQTNTTNPSADWNDLLVDAGARPCPQCGKHASIRAHTPNADVRIAVADAAPLADDSVWFCFECGHQDR